MFQRKKKKKTYVIQHLYHFSCFSLGLASMKLQKFCIFTALKADMLLLFSKDMLSIS